MWVPLLHDRGRVVDDQPNPRGFGGGGGKEGDVAPLLREKENFPISGELSKSPRTRQ